MMPRWAKPQACFCAVFSDKFAPGQCWLSCPLVCAVICYYGFYIILSLNAVGNHLEDESLIFISPPALECLFLHYSNVSKLSWSATPSTQSTPVVPTSLFPLFPNSFSIDRKNPLPLAEIRYRASWFNECFLRNCLSPWKVQGKGVSFIFLPESDDKRWKGSQTLNSRVISEKMLGLFFFFLKIYNLFEKQRQRERERLKERSSTPWFIP